MASKHNFTENCFRLTQFLRDDIWRIRADKLAPRRLFWITQLRIVLLAGRRFFEDNCQLRASGLTFYSLLSVVPVVALAFGIAKGFGYEKVLQAQLLEKLADQPDVAERIIGFARALLDRTKGGAIAGVGVVVLLWTVIKLLGNIEKSFNDIWGIKRARSVGRKLTDYLSVMMISPVLFIVASSVTVLLTTRLTSIIESLSFLGVVGAALIFLLRLAPYALIWVLFTFMYVFIPNTRVQFKSGLWGAIVGGTIYQLAQFAYIKFQIGVSNYGAIYGSFAALPLFLVWLQLSWLIVLFGAEISFAHQNVGAFEYEKDCSTLSHNFKRLFALMVAHRVIRSFIRAEKAPAAEDLAQTLEMPIRLVRSTLFELTEAGVLSEVGGSADGYVAYQPHSYPEELTIMEVLRRLDRQGTDAVPMAPSDTQARLHSILAKFEETNVRSPANLKLQEV